MVIPALIGALVLQTAAQASSQPPETGTLSLADLIAIGRAGQPDFMRDKYTPDPSKKWAGRDFDIVLSKYAFKEEAYDLNSKRLTITTWSLPSSIILWSEMKTKNTGVGENAFGAKVQMRESEMNDVVLRGQDVRREVTYTATLEPDAAKALATSVRLRVRGKIVAKANGSTLKCDFTSGEPTYSNPVTTYMQSCALNAVVTDAYILAPDNSTLAAATF